MKFELVESTFNPPVIPDNFLQMHWNQIEAKAKHCKQVCFNGSLYRLENIENNTIFVSEGIDYKTITALRNPLIPFNAETNVISILAIPITTDGKIVLGKATYYGDWENDRFELSGGFVTRIDLDTAEFSQQKVTGDWGVTPQMEYLYPRYTGIALETSLIYLAKLPLSSAELTQSAYSEFCILDHSKTSFALIANRQHEFHQTSFQILRDYLYNLKN